MADFYVVWCGSTLHFVAAWSHTRGELCPWPLQRFRPPGAEVLTEADYWPCSQPSQPVRIARRPRAWLDDDDDGL
jgi:hypothetical protein